MSLITSTDSIGRAFGGRKLIAVVYADMVGYSRLIGLDDIRTLERLRTLRRTLIDPTINEHGGNIVQTGGDSLLIVFDSIDGAVGCAVSIQQRMPDYDGDEPPDQAIRFRVGINIGDAIADGTDLHGDSVNIAVRLQAECPPGGICVSRAVHDHMRQRTDLALDELGILSLKNISRPVEAFVLRGERITSNPGAVQWADGAQGNQSALRQRSLPDKPSIAVLPFDNLSGDREQEYFADGIVEEIINGLSRIKWLFVISRNSTFIYKGKPIDVKTVGRELGVRYVLEGSVRRSGNHVRVTGQLIETETAAHVWADRYHGTLDDIFTLQDEMTMSVVGAVEPTLRKAEVERARRKRPENLDAYDLYLRALPLVATAMPENAENALRLLEAAIRLEPDYAVVHGFIAWCHEQRYLRGGLNAGTREAARRHAHAAIETGGDDAMALAMGGFVVGAMERDYETALEALDRSLALSPSSALAFGFSSIIRAWLGDDMTAIAHAGVGIRLSPYDPLIYLPYVGLAYAHFFAGNFVAAASAARRASSANPRFSVPCYLHTAALVRLGRQDEARLMANLLLELQPGFTVSGLVSGNITTPDRMGLLAGALRQVGLPEH